MTKTINETGNPAKIRQLNRNAVLRYIRSHRLCSRIELIKQLELAPATISAVVGDLLDEKLLIEVSPNDKLKPGRPTKKIALNANAAYVLGISLRIESNILYIDSSYSNYCGDIAVANSYECEDASKLELILSTIFQAVDELCALLGDDVSILGLGLGVPGVVHNESIVFAPNIPCIAGNDLYQKVNAYKNFPIFLENDVNLLLVTRLESLPELRPLNIAYVYISQGVGAAIALKNELWKSSGWSGEIGHLALPYEEGEYKSLEWLSSLDGFLSTKLAEQGIYFDASYALSPDVFELPSVKRVMEKYSYYLSLAVQVLNASFDFDKVFINLPSQSVLAYCMPLLLSHIESSPLSIAVEVDKADHQLVACGSALLALRHILAMQYSR